MESHDGRLGRPPIREKEQFEFLKEHWAAKKSHALVHRREVFERLQSCCLWINCAQCRNCVSDKTNEVIVEIFKCGRRRHFQAGRDVVDGAGCVSSRMVVRMVVQIVVESEREMIY